VLSSPHSWLRLVAFAAFALAACGPALSQSSSTPREVVVSSTGQVVAPWIEGQICRTGNRGCTTALYNPSTDEIARLGARLSSDFELTGHSQEVRRAETAKDKAIRLNRSGGAPAKPSAG
jgi:hypothetical protein